MSNPLVRLINNPKFSSFAQNTVLAVTAETISKGIARPAFTMMDKKSDKEARRFAAAQEGIYQATCLGLFLAVILPYRRAAFKIGQKLFKGEANFQAVKTFKQYKESEHVKGAITKYPLIKGWIEGNSILGSILCFTLLAPKVAHLGAPHLLKAMGFEKKPDNQKAETLQVRESSLSMYNRLKLKV